MVDELRAVVKELGGKSTFRRQLRNEYDLRDAIREGFPTAAIKGLMQAASLTLSELASSLDLSARSLQRRRRSGRLARYESDRLYRLARIVALAEECFASRDKAIHWLKQSNPALGGIRPLESLDTELGARQVENLLGRIAYGGIS